MPDGVSDGSKIDAGRQEAAASALAMGMSKEAAAGMGQMARGTLRALERSAEFRLMVREKRADIHARATNVLMDGAVKAADRLVGIATGALRQPFMLRGGELVDSYPDWASQVRAAGMVLDRVGVSQHGDQPAIEPEPNPFVGLSPEEARRALAMQISPLLEAAGMMAIPMDGGGAGGEGAEGGEGMDSGVANRAMPPSSPARSTQADDGVVLDLDAA